jgi:hypothetical protein
VGLEVLGRKRDVYVEQQDVKMAANGVTSYGVSPVSTCGGYGYLCCQPETQSGVGELYAQVTDCPKTCYSSCKARPVILSFTADPFPQGSPRTVSIGSGEPVSFSFVASTAADPHLLVTIDFGDGQTQEFRETTGSTNHEYVCASGNCQFQAAVTARDGAGGVAAVTSLTQIRIVVGR